MSRRTAVALALALLAWPAPTTAEGEFSLLLPVDCRPGVDCFVQNYVDTEAGPEARDFACGSLTYDGHTGTDIRVPSFAEMQAGVAVLAAAAGRVVGTRDGMLDNGQDSMDPTGPGVGKCGNGVWLGHPGGWTTQYCHMKRGSIAVERGDQVAAGQRLGEIGYSGNTEFPHLHLTVAHERQVVDPFTGRRQNEGCGGKPADRPLWSAAAAAQLRYRPSGLLGAGFVDRKPDWDDVKRGAFRGERLPAEAQALVFWVEVFGLRQGDREHLRLLAPDGGEIAKFAGEPVPRHRAVQFRFVGKLRRGGDWPPGRYLGEYVLLRPQGAEAVEALRVERALLVP